MELQGTETNINDIADLGPSVATLWNDAWIDPSILAWDEPVQGPRREFPEVLEMADPTLSPSRLELSPALPTSRTDTTSQSSNSPNQRVRFGVPLRESRASESPSYRPNNGIDEPNLKVRNRHNRVEKNYRSRLNSRFLGLLNVLLKDQENDNPRGGGKFEALSRGAVLDMASERIESLDAENHLLKLKLKTYDSLRGMYQIYHVQPPRDKHQS